MIAFIDSSNELRRSWLLSLARRKDGEDMDENNCRSLELVVPLMSSKYADMLLITANKAGYMTESLPWLVVMRL